MDSREPYVAKSTLRWPYTERTGCVCIQDDLVRSGIDQQICRLPVDRDRDDHFIHGSVANSHRFVAAYLRHRAAFECAEKRDRHEHEKREHQHSHGKNDGGCSVRCPQRISGHARRCAGDSARYSTGRVQPLSITQLLTLPFFSCKEERLSKSTFIRHSAFVLCRCGAQLRRTKATRGRVRTLKAAQNRATVFPEFCTKCFWSAMRPRIAFVILRRVIPVEPLR